MTTKVANVYRDEYTMRIGRPTKWGNPYKLPKRTPELEAKCLWQYALHLRESELIKHVDELKNHTLGCYCAPKRCHGDILARCADADDPRAELDAIIVPAARSSIRAVAQAYGVRSSSTE